MIVPNFNGRVHKQLTSFQKAHYRREENCKITQIKDLNVHSHVRQSHHIHRFITLSNHILPYLKSHDVSVYVPVQTSAWPASPRRSTAIAAVRGGRQALSPRPADRWLHQRPGIGDAAFLPRCIAAGCSPGTHHLFLQYSAQITMFHLLTMLDCKNTLKTIRSLTKVWVQCNGKSIVFFGRQNIQNKRTKNVKLHTKLSHTPNATLGPTNK
jgi:hypothetical protein